MKGIGMKGKTIRIASRERGENRLVHMLKQTYKLTGFIPLFRFLKGGGGREGGGRRIDKVDATAAPCVKE